MTETLPAALAEALSAVERAANAAHSDGDSPTGHALEAMLAQLRWVAANR